MATKAKVAKVEVKGASTKKGLIESISKEVSPVVVEAQSLVIAVQADMLPATELLSKLNIFNDRVVEDREKITKPLNAAIKEVRAKYKPVESSLEEAIEIVRGKMSTFQTKVIAEQKKVAAEAADKIASGEMSIEEGVASLEEAPAAITSVESKAGDVSFKTVQKLKITSALELIRDIVENHAGSFESFVEFNNKAILDALKAGAVMKGAEIEEVQVPINFRG